MMVALCCSLRIQENGQGQIFVLIQQNIAITLSQLRAKSGSGKFHHLCNRSAVYGTTDSICPDKTSCQAFCDTQILHGQFMYQLVSN